MYGERTSKTNHQAQIIFKISIAFNIVVAIFWLLCLLGVFGGLGKEISIFLPLFGMLGNVPLCNAFEKRAKRSFANRQKRKFLKTLLAFLAFLALISMLRL